MNKMGSGDYSDIIGMEHHVSASHPHMSMHDRAAQFAPFAALTGYERLIKEAGELNAAADDTVIFTTDEMDNP